MTAAEARDEVDAVSLPAPDQMVRECWKRLRVYRRRVVLAVVTLVGSTLASLAGPALIGVGIDYGIDPRRPHTLDVVAVVFLCCAIAALVLGRAQIRMVGGLGEQFCYDLRREVFGHLQALSLEFYDSERTGRLVARMTADFDALESLVQQGLIVLVTNMLLFVVAIGVLVVLSWKLFLVCLFVSPVLYLSSRRFQRDSKAAYLRVRERIGQTLVTVQEGLAGVRVIQAFAREDQQVQRFASHNEAQLHANIDAVRVSVRYFPVVELSAVVTMAGMVGIGGLFVHDGLAPLGTVVSFLLYTNSLFDPVLQMSQLFNQAQSSGAALRKLFAVLAVEPSLKEAPDAVELPAGGELRVEGLGFAYTGAPPPEAVPAAPGNEIGNPPGAPPPGPRVLSGVDLSVAPGEKLALVGPTGAGKSTLAKLIARMYDPTEGTVTLGGVDLRQATFASLRRRIVMVPQEGFLFRGTILDNVRIGRPAASDEEARAALETIGVLERFDAMPGGAEAVVEARGSTLSAGERQLISLARAALADPDVLILDEATSSLDPGTEAAVEAAMAAVSRGRTTIVIAHRLQTAADADRIAVIAEGGIAEIGTHADLLARGGGRYAELFQLWAAAGSQATESQVAS
jgi:ATP-binding cassette, subfamily B, bacterial